MTRLRAPRFGEAGFRLRPSGFGQAGLRLRPPGFGEADVEDWRIRAVIDYGVTARQACFLVTVMRHAGVCVPRQYVAFAGTAYGHTVNRFFDRLVQARYATPCGCLHNRARVFHVQHRGLYAAIGEPHSRFRRPVPAARAIERLMALDAVLALPDLHWLTTEAEQVGYFIERCRLRREDLPGTKATTRSATRPRAFPDALPIGVDGTGGVTFLALVTDRYPAPIRTVLRRYLPLLRALPAWTWRLVLPRSLATAYEACQAVVAQELEQPLDPHTIARLRAAFERRRAAHAAGVRRSLIDDGSGLPTALVPRVAALYAAWLKDGDAALGGASCRRIAEALEAGRGRVETVVLPYAYDHLAPLVMAGPGRERRGQAGHLAGDRAADPARLHGPIGPRSRPLTRRSADDCSDLEWAVLRFSGGNPQDDTATAREGG